MFPLNGGLAKNNRKMIITSPVDCTKKKFFFLYHTPSLCFVSMCHIRERSSMQYRPLITRSQTQKVRMGGISEIADSRARPTTTMAMVPLSPSLCWPRRHWHSWVLEEPVLSHTYVLMHLHFLMKLLSTSLSLSLSLAKLHYAANITNDSADTPLGEEAKLAAPQRGTRPAKWAGRHPVLWGDSRELLTSP